MILEHVWNSSFEGLTNVVDVCISALRSKVDRDFPQKLIQTKRGIGYTFTCVTDFPRAAKGFGMDSESEIHSSRTVSQH
jgi:DNA-binding winged helix-turn-helix (wHTH) protein